MLDFVEFRDLESTASINGNDFLGLLKSLELFRSTLRTIRLVTYDELFGKVRLLIDLLEGNLSSKYIDATDLPF